jgi:hypothetical protein
MTDVQRFFHKRHPGSYKLYNLCSERWYEASKFEGRVSRHPFDDHNPCEFDRILPIMHDIHSHLHPDGVFNPQRVAAIHCLAEDHQVLTNRGFLGMKEVYAYSRLTEAERAVNPLLFASYDEVSHHLVYQSASDFIFNDVTSSEEMVSFADPHEYARWSDDADKYGRVVSSREVPDHTATSGVHLQVTTGHDMFVQLTEDFTKHDLLPPMKVKAGQLTSDKPNQQLKFTAAARSGVQQSYTQAEAMPFIDTLSLKGSKQVRHMARVAPRVCVWLRL